MKHIGTPLPPLPPKSPFLVFQNFISPLLCEHIIALTYDDTFEPNLSRDGTPIPMVKTHERVEDILNERLVKDIVPQIEKHYEVKYRALTDLFIEWYPEECKNTNPVCENASYFQKKWVKTKDRDLSAVLFLCDYQTTVPFDGDFEVYGGKLEFMQHGFGFNPQRGTLIVYPSGPHFINATTMVCAGDLFQVRFQMATQLQYLYNPCVFAGNFQEWFKEIA